MRTRRFLGSGPAAADARQIPHEGRPATVAELVAAAAETFGHDQAEPEEALPVAATLAGRRPLGDGPSS